MRQRRHVHQLGLYERVLAGFLADPAGREHLPQAVSRSLMRAPHR
jgi:hypothetical protein